MNLMIKNSLGEQLNIVVIRYFNFNGGRYLIFTKNEIDEAGYQKLFISKIDNMVGNNISDEMEWNLVRDTIKVIAKANKDNTALPIQDLNENELNGIQVNGQKPFKLTSSSVALLSANKNVQQIIPATPLPMQNEQSIVPPIAPISQANIDFVSPFEQTGVQMSATPISTNAPSQPIMPNLSTNNVAPIITPSVQEIQNQASISPVISNDAVSQSNSLINPTIANPTEPIVDLPVVPVVPLVAPVVPETQAYVSAPTESVDYKKLYEEQTLKLNALTVELDRYKLIVEQLKNILN